MKRFLSCILCAFLLISLCCCNSGTDDIKIPAQFYYKSNPANYFSKPGVLASEVREIKGHDNRVIDILNDYLSGPKSDELVSPFPAGTKACSVVRKDSTLIITFNTPFSSLSGIDLSIACASIAMTLSETTDCSSIEILVGDELLNNVESIRISTDSLYLFDSTAQLND